MVLNDEYKILKYKWYSMCTLYRYQSDVVVVG